MISKSIRIKNLLKNSIILSLPGFLSIFLSVISIPIHLKVAGLENYGNYLLFHILLSLSLLLNLGISKSLVICSNFEKKSKSLVAYDAIKLTINIILIIFALYICFKFLIFEINNYIFSLDLLLLGLIISILYHTFEGILQSNKYFKNISLINFIFYSLSLSLPSIILIFFNNLSLNELIILSILIKLLIILYLFFYFFKKKLIKKNSKKKFFKYFKKNSPWLSLNCSLVQIYEMMDKYLIKIFMGASLLAIYSIPQQLTGKLSIISKSFSAFLLPNMKNRNNEEQFIYSLEFFIKYIPIIIFMLFPFYPYILNLWLGDQYSQLLFDLTRLFSLIAIFSCISHILVTKFEADQISNQNFKIEFFLLPIFLFLLFYLVINLSSLIYISILILLKELYLILLRLYFLKFQIKMLRSYLIYLFTFPILLIFSFFNMHLFYILLVILIIITIKNAKFNN